MARYFVDVVNGLDSNAGTEAAPFATITKAITTATGASDIVVVESGIYREQITFQGAGGVTGPQYIIARGRVIVDGEDVRYCMANGSATLGGSINRVAVGTWINFIFRGPLSNIYISLAGAAISESHNLTFVNCVFYDVTSNTTGYIFDSSYSGAGTLCSIQFYRCTFKRFGSIDRNGITPHADWTTYIVKHSIIELTNTFGSKTPTSDSENAYAGGAFVNTSVNAPVYTDETYGVSEDLSLLRSNATVQNNYLGVGTTTGEELSDLGASWHPQFGNLWLGEMPPSGADIMNDESWASDTNYDNGTDQGPAALAGTSWAVDTITQPSAIKAAVVSPVWKVPVQNGRTATLKSATWMANEDTAPASGQKDVVDADAGATRTIQYRHSETQFAQQDASGGAVPAWTAIDRDDILVATHNVNFWIQLRAILTLEGD